MGYKKRRLGPTILDAARSGLRYNDVHVFFGGTGAVGGTALLQMIDIYEEMMTIRPPTDDEVPVLVATGVTRDEIRTFTQRLFRVIEARHGKASLPTPVRSGYLTHSGIFVAMERFQVVPLPAIDAVLDVPQGERRALVADYLKSLGTHISAEVGEIHAALTTAIAAIKPFSDFLASYQAEHLVHRGIERFRSVVLGIPLPSLIAYHLAGLEEVVRHIPGYDAERFDELRHTFELAIRDDTAHIDEAMADNTLVAHTTAVGGMYDEHEGRVSIRLGFAHSAVDQRIYEKQRAAVALTDLYAKRGIKMLVTAAAIGVDEVRVRARVPVHHQVQRMLFDASSELFPGSKEAMPSDSRASILAGRPVPRRQMVRTYPPITIPLGSAKDASGATESEASAGAPLCFERGEDLMPSHIIRSGENGYFSVANADALYRVMRVASASELGLVLASTALFGDDEQSPWFRDSICYYTETDNARQVFDFVNQPMLRQAQLSGLDPMSLQDLGNAKHQAELHTLGLLILLHRLRTLDIDAIAPYVDLARFDARTFFVEHSRALLFEDIYGWEPEALARDLRILVSASAPECLEELKPFIRHGHEDLYPLKQAARRQVLDVVMKAVWSIPSLGTPILYEDEAGQAMVRTGYFCAPFDRLVASDDAIGAAIIERQQETGGSFEDQRDFHLATGGFIDVRPHALLTWAQTDRDPDLGAKILRLGDEEALRQAIASIEPYSFFATCGLTAVLYRLRSLYGMLREALIDLGTLQDFGWLMPRDEQGHLVLVPGVVEAFRMVSEGLEKATGTDRLDGIWGYERRRAPERRSRIPMGE